MEYLIREYKSWLSENRSLIDHLKSHDSTLYSRIMPIYEVLNYLSEELNEDLNEDLLKIMQIGFEYLYTQVDTCQLYLEKVFGQDFHALLAYEKIIAYILYLEDLRYELHEHDIENHEAVIHRLTKELEEMMEKRLDIPDNIHLYIDHEINQIINKDITFHSIIDIFVEIAETLGIELYLEADYVVGKDI